MTAKTWKSKIKKAARAAGTYRPFFDSAIETLAGILEYRDDVVERYRESGEGPVVQFTNKNGSTNTVKNPLLVMINELNASALTFWRELGLTPAGLKKINEASLKEEKKKNGLLDLLGDGNGERV